MDVALFTQPTYVALLCIEHATTGTQPLQVLEADVPAASSTTVKAWRSEQHAHESETEALLTFMQHHAVNLGVRAQLSTIFESIAMDLCAPPCELLAYCQSAASFIRSLSGQNHHREHKHFFEHDDISQVHVHDGCLGVGSPTGIKAA